MKKIDFTTVPGEVGFLVEGNYGKIVNAHATAFRIARVRMEAGMFDIEILEEKDIGAVWSVPFEEIGSYHFAEHSKKLSLADCIMIVQTILKFDEPLDISVNKTVRRQTLSEIAAESERVREWLQGALSRIPLDINDSLGYRHGNQELTESIEQYLRDKRLLRMDKTLATNIVHNPYSGELVKAHAIVLAEMGLAPYKGKIIREPSVLEGSWSRARRRIHIISRLAFMRAMWPLLEQANDALLYRAFGSPKKLSVWRPSFVSSTFSREIAQMLYNSKFFKEKKLLEQPVPTERLFMTFLETRAMCKQYTEAEALLIGAIDTESVF